jgi:hypothetical protein
LTDLTFIDDGNPDFRDAKGKGKENDGHVPRIINFDKYMKTARIILEIQRFQQVYNLIDVPEIQEFLKFELNSVRDEDPNSLYQRSLALEPREDQLHSGEKLELMLQDEGLL